MAQVCSNVFRPGHVGQNHTLYKSDEIRCNDCVPNVSKCYEIHVNINIEYWGTALAVIYGRFGNIIETTEKPQLG